MEPTPTPAAQPAPKLAIDKFSDGGIACLRFSGTVDEAFEGRKLAATVKAKTLVLDLGGVKKISSFGIREWVDFVKTVGDAVDDIVLVECAPKVVDQLNMVGNFAGKGRVFSFYGPYRCDYCDADARVLFQVDRDWESIKAMKPAQRPCATCGEPQYFDEDATTYFSYVVGQQPFELDAEVAAFLSAKLNYAVSEASRKLRVDKVIEGRSTYLRLAGDLDAGFPREKLAEGLEGLVIVDVAGLGRIEPAGAAEWRGFLQMVTPGCDALLLLGAPPTFLEKLTRPEDLGPKGQVVSFSIPYTCATCATTSLQAIDVEQHHDVLKLATPPEVRCADCKQPMTCAASEHLLAQLPGLPRPSVSADARKFIKDVRDRKPEKKKVATTVAEAAAQARGGSFSMALLAAVLVAALMGGAFLVWQSRRPDDAARSAGPGRLVARAADARPAWITGDTPLLSYCADAAEGGMSCVGVSSLAASREEAEEEAREAALEGVADGLAVRIKEPAWQRMTTLWAQARQARMTEFQQEPGSAKARRALRDARSRVAAALLATAGSAVPPAPAGAYWEEFDNGARQFLAFAQYELSGSAVKKLVDTYARTETVLGATVATVYPLIAWKFPKVEQGAVVLAVEPGPIQAMGVASPYVLLGVGVEENALKAVDGAAQFKEYAAADYARLEKQGGTLFVSVERGEDAPRTYELKVAPPAVAQPDRDRDRTKGASGGDDRKSVNNWDRFSGTKPGSVDDPTQ